jgi:hypothetical protein
MYWGVVVQVCLLLVAAVGEGQGSPSRIVAVASESRAKLSSVKFILILSFHLRVYISDVMSLSTLCFPHAATAVFLALLMAQTSSCSCQQLAALRTTCRLVLK